jgi:uncharacterized protein involved in high-affinity Fe2+ transport
MRSSIRYALAGPVLALALAASASARAGEQPAGAPTEINGLSIRGVFLQAVKMDPALPGQEAEAADIHLEADVAALPGGRHGLPAGSWVPYLDIGYRLAKAGSDWSATGKLWPMVASDGPHYGANVALDGPGEYAVAFTVRPPSANGVLRHYDRETGVDPWWAPFTYEGTFVFAGTGKKGGY